LALELLLLRLLRSLTTPRVVEQKPSALLILVLERRDLCWLVYKVVKLLN